MGQIINTNIASINAQRNLERSQGENQTALQRLSSGLRINSARDDAAGLAISTRFTSQVQGLAVAIRNAGDGVSLAQTAEGALGSITDNLLRIRDLAIQSANATNSAIDREALNAEVQQLIEEVDRVSLQTTFNGTNLLDGTFEDVTFQIGANEGESVTFGINGTTIDQLGASATDGISSDPQDNATAAALSAGDLIINGIAIAASSGVDDTFSSGAQDQSAIAKAAAINEATVQTGVEAVVNGTFVGGSAFPAGGSTETGDISINGITISLATDASVPAPASLSLVAETINTVSGQTGVTATFSGNPAQGIQLSADDGRNIIIADVTGDASVDFGLAAAGTFTGSFTLISTAGDPIDLDTSTGNIANAGLAVGTFSGNNSGIISGPVPAQDLVAGDIVVNGVPIGPGLSTFDTASTTAPQQSAIAKAAAINAVADQTGVTASANSTIFTGGTISATPTGGVAVSGSFDINGVTVNLSFGGADSATDRQNSIVNAVNNVAGQTGVTAEAFGSTYRLIAEDGRNIFIDNTGTGFNAADTGLPAATQTVLGSVTLLSSGIIELDTITGNIANSGFEVGTYGSNVRGVLVQDIDISTVEGSIDALNAVDNALNAINLQRANLGAIQNRFESTIQNQLITSENLATSNSRIRDADFAAETAELSRTSVLQSAGLSILSQANAQPQNVLQLLQ